MLRALIDATIHEYKLEKNGDYTNHKIIMQRPYKDQHGFAQTDVIQVDALTSSPEHTEYRDKLMAHKGKRVLLPVTITPMVSKAGKAWQIVRLDSTQEPQVLK